MQLWPFLLRRLPHPPGSPSSPLPQPRQRQLSNGVALVELDLPQAPLICLDFWCRAGSATETDAESGLAHFLEHMVFKGSEQLPAGAFDRRVEALGGSSNAATGFDDVHYHLLIPPEGAPEALDLLLDLVLRPRLAADDFAMERQVVLEELAQSEDQPEEVAFQDLLRRACSHHAYGLPILGRREALETHQPEAMAAFHQRHYRADRCCLAVAGPLAGLDLTAQLEASPLAALAVTHDPQPVQPFSLNPGEATLTLPRLEAARLLMAWRLPAAADQSSVMGGDLLTTLLAEGRRSRLVERLREQLRLVESIDLDLNVLEAGCLVLLEAVCDVEQLAAVEREVRAVLEGLLHEPPRESEVERARRLVGNGYRFSLEAPGSVAAMVGNSALWGRTHNLEAPLHWLEQWDGSRLSRDLIPLLNPDLAYTLRAVPA
jgi:predicted Zn-dependent peptidase